METVFTITGLTAAIRELLENQIGEVEVEGEISNFRRQNSGHLYFTLKDSSAQLRGVMFRGEAGYLRFEPRDGQMVVARGQITVYAARGEYQLRVRSLKPKGKGSLQEQFGALKRKLEAEGLFSAERKRLLPAFPRRIGIVTSPTGAALRDFLNVIGRRCPRMELQVFGVRVQGQGAAEEIAMAVREFNRLGEVDVIVLARGGGSLEDLWAFNEEVLARVLAESEIPTVSAVGHEIDFTIADFVADLRAPTPSAAAELLGRGDEEWRDGLESFQNRLDRAVRGKLSDLRWRWKGLEQHYIFKEPRRLVEQWSQRLDETESRLLRGMGVVLGSARERGERAERRWRRISPELRLKQLRERLRERETQLRLLSPQSTLERGYAIVFDSDRKVIRRAEGVKEGEEVTVRMVDGEFSAGRLQKKNKLK